MSPVRPEPLDHARFAGARRRRAVLDRAMIGLCVLAALVVLLCCRPAAMVRRHR